MLRKQCRHFFLTFEVKFFGFKPHPVDIFHRFAGLDAHKYILHAGILPTGIMCVIGGDQWNTGFFRNSNDTTAYIRIFRQIVILNFQIIIFRTEYITIFQCRLFCSGIILL